MQKTSEIKQIIARLEAVGASVNLTTIRAEMHKSHLPPRKTIIQRFDEYMYAKRTKVAWLTYMRSNQLRAKLKRFEASTGEQIVPEKFNHHTFERFTQFLSVQDKLNDNSIKRHVQTLRGFLKYCHPGGNYSFLTWKEQYFDVIYLEEWELQILKNACDLPPYLEKCRDMFLIAYYTGVRWSDLPQVKLSNVRDGVLFIMQTKTKTMAYPPFLERLRELLQKHGGVCPYESNQKMNDYLKLLFQRLELNRPVTIHKRIRGSVIKQVCPLHEVISAHAARKTFIMTLLSRKIPINDIMHMSGHADYNSMRPYIAVDTKRLKSYSKELSGDGGM